jgi:hypothetical protein
MLLKTKDDFETLHNPLWRYAEFSSRGGKRQLLP